MWLFDQSQMPVNVGDVCDVSMNCMSTENRNVNIGIMNNDISGVTLPVTDDNDGDDDHDDAVLNLDDVACDKSKNVADAEHLALEQQNDKSLALCFSLAKRDKAGYFIRDGILYLSLIHI